MFGVAAAPSWVVTAPALALAANLGSFEQAVKGVVR